MSNDLIILTAVGSHDRPGIMAALTGVVLDHGGNLDDATMTRLHGAFATMIAARLDSWKISGLRDALDRLSSQLSLTITLERLDTSAEVDSLSTAHADHIVTVYGADHPGIVHSVAKLLQKSSANITDLKTRLTGQPGSQVYVMIVETYGGDWDLLPSELAAFGKAQHVDVSFSLLDEETL